MRRGGRHLDLVPSARWIAHATSVLAILVGGSLTAVGLHGQSAAVIERGPLPEAPSATYHRIPEGIRLDTLASGLEVVWDMDRAADGRLFIAERAGRVRTLSGEGALVQEPWLDLVDRVYLGGESGIMGIAVHPEFPFEPWVYLMYSVGREPGAPFDRVSRFREANGASGVEEILLDGLPARGAGGGNRGGSIAFGPDGMLYISVGDNFQRAEAADPTSPHGSILRLTATGSVPDDNPWTGNPVWAYGLRNVHGIAWHPTTGAMFAADHGPSSEGGIRGHDRILVVEKGKNHGWPSVVGAPGNPAYVDPILVFQDPAPPGDLVFHEGDLYMSMLGFDPLGAQGLVRVSFGDAAQPHRPTLVERWFNDETGATVFGRIRGLAVGPEGALYLSTSNRDGRGSGGRRGGGDDRVVRVTIP